jgi:hypothetical protein
MTSFRRNDASSLRSESMRVSLAMACRAPQ